MDYGSSGNRVWIAWDDNFIDVNVVECGTQFIHCLVNIRAIHESVAITIAYGATEMLYSVLISPWLIGGDFNAVRDLSEVCGTSGDIQIAIEDFNAAIQNTGLLPLPMQGEWYTWHNHSATPRNLWKRLDRMLINDRWMARFPNTFYSVLTPRTSDHSPMVLNGDQQQQYGGMFRFDNYLARSPEFIPSVQNIWQHNIFGTPMYAVTRKLKALKPIFREQRRNKGDLSHNVQMAKGFLEAAQLLVSSRRRDELYIQLEHCCRLVLAKATKLEQIMLNQRAKMQWMKGGDQCSRVFFRKIAQRRSSRRIFQINDDQGSTHTDPEETVGWHILSNEESTALLLPFTPADVKQAVFDIAEDKAPGPDGYSSGFFKAKWPIVGQENQTRLPPRCALKVDIRKAYDTVDWDFLIEVLEMFGLPITFVKWIEECVTTPSFSIGLNGKPHGFFRGARGLRQGDPLSPYLFMLVMEVLHLGFLQLIDQEELFSYHWKCEAARIFQLGFADDVILFSRADMESLRIFKAGLDRFAKWSGLRLNVQKSHLIISRSPQTLREEMSALLGFQEGVLQMRYLGLPLLSSRLTIADCHPLLLKIDKRIAGWEGTPTTHLYMDDYEPWRLMGWRKILRLRMFLRTMVDYRIGDGRNFFLWQDPWHHLGPLCDTFPRGPRLLGLDESSKLRTVIHEGELLTGYNQVRLPPRCTLKVDIRKAYDTVDHGDGSDEAAGDENDVEDGKRHEGAVSCEESTENFEETREEDDRTKNPTIYAGSSSVDGRPRSFEDGDNVSVMEDERMRSIQTTTMEPLDLGFLGAEKTHGEKSMETSGFSTTGDYSNVVGDGGDVPMRKDPNLQSFQGCSEVGFGSGALKRAVIGGGDSSSPPVYFNIKEFLLLANRILDGDDKSKAALNDLKARERVTVQFPPGIAEENAKITTALSSPDSSSISGDRTATEVMGKRAYVTADVTDDARADVTDDVTAARADVIDDVTARAYVTADVTEDVTARAYVTDDVTAGVNADATAKADVTTDMLQKNIKFQNLSTNHTGLFVGNIPFNTCPDAIVEDKIAQAFNYSTCKTLTFIAPTMQNGEVIVRPTLDIIRNGSKRWRTTAVGYFLGKRPYFYHVKEFAMSVWSDSVEVTATNNGFFFFQFQTIIAMEDIIEGGPWLFQGQPIVLQKWEPGMVLRKLKHTQVPVWIKLRRLPMELWTEEGLSTVASGVGKPLYPDAITRACTRLDFARVCVMLDITSQLPKHIIIMTPDEEGGEMPCKVDVEYEWVPPKFTGCMSLGHSIKDCSLNKIAKLIKPPVSVYVPKSRG
ncbi:UNVERIFIED_CONTAM: hypothetical protein Sindi_3039700 [Sesamum indicum]